LLLHWLDSHRGLHPSACVSDGVIAVDGATHSQKDGMEGNGGSLEDGAKAFVLFLRGAQLVLRSSVFTVLDLDEVNVTFENAQIFGSVLSGEGGSANGWQCC